MPAPVSSPVPEAAAGLEPGVGQLGAIDEILCVEGFPVRRSAFLRRIGRGNDDGEHHVDEEEQALGQDGQQHEHDADDGRVDVQVRAEAVADAGEHRPLTEEIEAPRQLGLAI